MAQNTLVTITYSVKESKRQELEGILRDIVERINAAQQAVRCSAYCGEDDPTTFVEVYECDSNDAYDALEDSLDDETSQKIRRIATEFAQARQAVMTLRRVA
jgi:quinol monooxygenase YgiN